jgi:uncharacterized RDD family membrane protein YckC
MSTTEPPAGSTPPPGGESTPPPPPMSTPPPASTPPPMDTGAPPPPPPPATAGGYGAPTPPAPAAGMGGAPAAASGVGQPGNLLDRFLARLIDGVILGVAFAIINGVVGSIIYSGIHSTGEVFLYYLITGVVETVIGLGYFGYLESSRGQTIGKQVMKLRTFGPDGTSNPTMEQAIRRNIFYALPLIAIVPVLGWILYIVAAIASIVLIVMGINSDPRRQHWFDKFAGGTQVMKVG